MKKTNIFAAAVTGMMLASSAMADNAKPKAAAKGGDAMKKVHCFGVNECKGKSECEVKGANSCSGANSCKGKGWMSMAMKECTGKKGKIVD